LEISFSLVEDWGKRAKKNFLLLKSDRTASWEGRGRGQPPKALVGGGCGKYCIFLDRAK
jgi:hypothetical protein